MTKLLQGIVEPIYMDPEHPANPHPDWSVHYDFVRFDHETGRITSRGAMIRPHILREQLQQGGILIGNGHWTTHYVDLADGVPTLRELTACPARQSGTTLTDLPVPCQIEITANGVAPALYDWADPVADLSFEHPGVYAVRVLSVPHHPGTFTVTVDV